MTPIRRWGGAALYAGLALTSLVPAAVSSMIFDAPGSEDNQLTEALFAGFAGAPPLLLVSAGLIATANRRQGRMLTLLALAMPVLLIAYVAVVLTALQVVCDGTFTCRR